MEPWGDRLDEEEFAFRQFSLPARSTPYPPGVKVPPNLRRNIAWLVTKWPEGLSQVRLAELYGKEFGLSINTTRDCGCSLGTLIKHLHGDVLELKAGQSPSDVAIFPRGYKTDADVFEDGSTPSLLSVPVVPPPRSVHLAPIPPPRRVTTAQVGHQSISMTSLAPVQLETGEVIRSDPNTDRLALPGYVHPGIRVLPPPANLNLRKLLRNCILVKSLAIKIDLLIISILNSD